MTVNTITGRSAFLSLLEDEGVGHLFGNPGTTELPIMDALPDHPSLRYIMALQESVVVAMADGYARASGQLAACNVHVAPGLGNAMGSLYNANWFGSPLLLTAGQQEQGHGLMEPLLSGPLVEMAAPLTKWAIEVTRLDDLPRIVRRAAKIATTPPTGPVFLSLPGDILNQEGAIDLGVRTRIETANRPDDHTLARLADRLIRAKHPVIVAGHEIATSDAFEEAGAFASALGAPVYQQTAPWGAHFPSEHPNFMGALTRVQAQVRETLAPYDLLICLGCDVLRMSVFSPVDALPDDMPIVQIGQNDWEMGKNYSAEIAVRADVKQTLSVLAQTLQSRGGAALTEIAKQRLEIIAPTNWSANRARIREQLHERQSANPIDPTELTRALVDGLPGDAIVVEEAIVTGRPLLDQLAFKRPTDYFGLASGGIGFAIAGALGVQLAHPQRPVVALIGDGSAMYSIQALWTAANQKLPITFIVANNRSYRILKERLLAFHGNDSFIGMDLTEPAIDFVGLAESMGVSGTRVETVDAFDAAFAAALDATHPCLLDVRVSDGFSE